MMMASIPGAPLPDTVPSDALLYAAKKSIGTASTSGGIGVGRCDLHTARSDRGGGAAGKGETLLGQESAAISRTEAAAHTSAASSTLVEAENRKWGGHRE
jgi:hypothetical protein